MAVISGGRPESLGGHRLSQNPGRTCLVGSLSSLNEIISLIQPGIFNLAVHMLGNREDAADATQEILLKVVTHLSSFRSDSAFATWMFRVAKNHLLTAATQYKESPEMSLEGFFENLERSMAFNNMQAQLFGDRPMQPVEKLEAKQIALGCTQKMLSSRGKDQRLPYILDSVFGLSSEEAALVLDIYSNANSQLLTRVA